MGKICTQCLKVFVILFNFLIVLVGLGTFIITVYIYFEPVARDMSHATGHYDIIKVTLCVMMALGCLTIVLGTFGCCGAYHESECLLGTYFTLLLVVFFVEIASGVIGFLFQKQIMDGIDSSMQNGVRVYDIRPIDKNNATIKYMDRIQNELKCCGDNSGKDYKLAIPLSCCRLPPEQCKPMMRLKLHEIHPRGCTSTYQEYVKKKFILMLYLLMGIAAIEFMGLLFSMVLCCSLRRYEAGYVGVDYLQT